MEKRKRSCSFIPFPHGQPNLWNYDMKTGQTLKTRTDTHVTCGGGGEVEINTSPLLHVVAGLLHVAAGVWVVLLASETKWNKNVQKHSVWSQQEHVAHQLTVHFFFLSLYSPGLVILFTLLDLRSYTRCQRQLLVLLDFYCSVTMLRELGLMLSTKSHNTLLVITTISPNSLTKLLLNNKNPTTASVV